MSKLKESAILWEAIGKYEQALLDVLPPRDVAEEMIERCGAAIKVRAVVLFGKLLDFKHEEWPCVARRLQD